MYMSGLPCAKGLFFITACTTNRKLTWFCSSWFNAKILKFYFDSQATLNYNLVHAVGIFGVIISGKAW